MICRKNTNKMNYNTINKCTVVTYADSRGYAPGKHSLLNVGSNIQQSAESVVQCFS